MRPLVPSDVNSMLRLKEAAAWNQTVADLQRNFVMEPEGHFGIDCDGVLASTSSIFTYGQDLAWIGMVLTDPAFRGRGFARKLFAHCLDVLDARGIRCSKLDASSMGEPLYRTFGFEGEHPIERWVLSGLAPRTPAVLHTASIDPGLDKIVFAADRKLFLDRLAANGCIDLGNGQYAMGRHGSHAAYFGPMVALDPATARRGLDWFLGSSGQTSVYWDLFPSNAAALDLAKAYGFQPSRQLLRMRRGPKDAPDIQAMYAIAGFEYG